MSKARNLSDFILILQLVQLRLLTWQLLMLSYMVLWTLVLRLLRFHL